MDRSPLQQVDVHDGLDPTLTMLGHRLGAGVEVVRDYDRSLPKLPAYEGELNQVWTNLVDNAVDAMDGSGTLTVRTRRAGDRVRKGTGLGLDIAGGSWCSATAATCGSPRPQATPLPGAAADRRSCQPVAVRCPHPGGRPCSRSRPG